MTPRRETPPQIVQQWQDVRARLLSAIADAESILALSVGSPRQPPPTQPPPTRTRRWTDQQTALAAELVFGGEQDDDTYHRHLGMTYNETKQRLWSARPPYYLDIRVRERGRTDWKELWELTASLYGRGWPKVVSRLALRQVGYADDPNEHIDRAALNEMRRDYHARAPWPVFCAEVQRALAGSGAAPTLAEMRSRMAGRGVSLMPKMVGELAMRYNYKYGPTLAIETTATTPEIAPPLAVGPASPKKKFRPSR